MNELLTSREMRKTDAKPGYFTKTEVFAFECFPKQRPEWARIINAPTASKARYEYWLDVNDAWDGIKLIDIRSRKVGGPHTSEGFKRNAAYRGMPDVRCGDRVRVGNSEGVIVGHNSSANFDVLFNSGEYAGARLNVHPSEVTFVGTRPEGMAGEHEHDPRESRANCGRCPIEPADEDAETDAYAMMMGPDAY